MLNRLQQGLMRRQVRWFLGDQDLADQLVFPITRQVMAGVKKLKVEDATAIMQAGDFSSLIKTVVAGLATDEHLHKATVEASPFLDMLLQLFQQLLPMLIGCFAQQGPPTPQAVLAAIQ